MFGGDESKDRDFGLLLSPLEGGFLSTRAPSGPLASVLPRKVRYAGSELHILPVAKARNIPKMEAKREAWLHVRPQG